MRGGEHRGERAGEAAPHPAGGAPGPPVPGLALPAGWDFAGDLVVLVGAAGEETIRALRARGQERIVRYAPARSGAPAEGSSPGVVSPPALAALLLELPGAPPRQVVLSRTPDPWATEARHREAAAAVRDALLARRLHATTIARMGPTWLRQGLENLPALAAVPSVAALEGAFAGQPAVLVSPGPSLSGNLRALPGLAGRVLLLAGTHALGTLRRVGVAPHVVLAADPGDLRRHLEGAEWERIELLAAGATCRSEVFQLPARRIVSFASNAALDDWIYGGLGEDARLATGGSVACSAFSLARRLGCDPILFVGQDLSFPGGRYYAAECEDGAAEVVAGEREGTFFLKKPPGAAGPGGPLPDGGRRVTRDQERRTLPGWAGGEVPTSASFQAFHTWFVATIGGLGGRPRVLNCTEGGARIPGMEHLGLAEAAAALPSARIDAGVALDRALGAVDLAARRARLAAHVGAMAAALAPALALARRAARLAALARGDSRHLAALAAAEGELSAALKPLPLLALVAQAEIRRAQEEGRRATNLAASLAASTALFGVVERAVELLQEPIERARAALAAGAR
ncbi:MAG: 6-hydroxymethylpterin diphosphokinase MptE-like protein [Planctomycetota bacterium]